MALNNLTKQMIRAVVKGDISTAKAFAKHIVDSDKTAKNESFCNSIKRELETQKNFIELPANIKNLVIAEDLRTSFLPNRHYLSENERSIWESIETMYKVSEMLHEKSIPYKNTVLLHGPSGTGKTTFGRYVAYSMGLPFMYLNFSSLIDSYLGKTGKNLNQVFAYANSQKCILMLDEIDVIAGKRGAGQEVGEISRITVNIMQELDNLSHEIVLLAATNRYDILDDAVKRRFSLTASVPEFCGEDKAKMIKKFIDDIDFSLDEKAINSLVGIGNQATIMNALIRMIAETYKTQVENKQELKSVT